MKAGQIYLLYPILRYLECKIKERLSKVEGTCKDTKVCQEIQVLTFAVASP